ncbi:MAG: HAD-IIIC family phosphatase [Chloroflexi bacterium]|nr:HAD-IIIC family phosphatase [Chloroflexota bacterium]
MSGQVAEPTPQSQTELKTVKCVVWDLDNTLWKGILLENDQLVLADNIVQIIQTLDERGILQSVASRNDHDAAMDKLRELGLDEYFLYPQINWNPKSASVEKIAKSINIGLDTIAFVDDQPFEREEVQFVLPAVRTLDVTELSTLLDRPDMNPRFLTEDSKLRRQMYMSDIKRQEIEDSFGGSNDEFLASLNMRFTIAPAQEDDLQRAEELTVRTNQLNTTGYTYGYEELDFLRQSPDHKLLIAGLEDKYGTYGKIGLTLIECGPEVWTIKLLLMSCRVMSRGVGTILIGHIMNMAREAGVKLHSEFVSNDRNRMMYITYKFNGFKEVSSDGKNIVFEADLDRIPPFPAYVDVSIQS